MKLKAMLISAMIGVATGAGAATAQADTVYSNPWNGYYGGNCAWSTGCGGQGDDYAAQEFSISSTSTLDSASWVEVEPDGGGPTSINWALYQANGTDGLPGTLVSSGNSPDTLQIIGTDPGDPPYYAVQGTFALPDVTLTSGSYYLALQSVSDYPNYLAGGTYGGGAAETHDGGLTWAPGYEYNSSLPVTITAVSAAPEPATWALMISGIALTGGIMRTRARRSALLLGA